MRDISLPAPLTSGNLCPDCGGTGADAEKTRAAYKSGHLSKSSGGHIRCWTCNGNGLDPAAYFHTTARSRPAVSVVRGNDLYFPDGNENGDHYEPLWIASWGDATRVHGRTPFTALLRAARKHRAAGA